MRPRAKICVSHDDDGMVIQAVSLDLDDTLWDIWATIERAEQSLHDWLVEHHPAIPQAFTTVELRGLARTVVERWPDIAHDRTEVRKRAFRLAAELTDSADFSEHTAFEIFYAGRNNVLFYDDALPALNWLQQHFPLVALTNGNANLSRIGIDHFFVGVLSSGDLGCSKPDPRMFLAACEYLQLPPQAVCHIGDDPELDIAGAAEVGMRTVWLNRKQQDYPADYPKPDAEINSLSELENILPRWSHT